ncbi:MAG: CehA/McbA family metallohydrolase [Deltaproteobacteria bacterium]|nr:CehA/McbA family metallohydrolase [Deltaproteobacteria bacterium]
MRRSAQLAGAVLAVALAACRSSTPTTSGALVVRITDGVNGPPLSGRVLLWRGTEPVHLGTRDYNDGKRQIAGLCKAGTALGTWDGIVVTAGVGELPLDGDGKKDCAIAPGRYRVSAWRGFEHERWEGEIEIAATGRTELTIPLVRAWRADGAVAADLHVHAATSNDSGLPDAIRLRTEAAAGIDVVALTNHDVNDDGAGAIHAAGLDGAIATIAGNEFGNDRVHLGMYPVGVARDQERGGSPSFEAIKSWSVAQMMDAARAAPGRPIVQVNHPRFRFYALYDGTGWNGTAWPPPFPLGFDAVEVLNGHTSFNAPGDRRIDDSVRDFYTLIAHGALVTAVGNSDTHHLNGVRDGLARSYVFMADRRLAPFDVTGFVGAIRGRRAVATTCPWLAVRATAGGASAGPGQALTAKGGAVTLEVTIAHAAWCGVDAARIRVGGTIARTIPITAQRETTISVPLEVGAADTWIGVDAGGEGTIPVEMTGTYQQEKGRPGVTPFAIANPVLIDADGDGRVTFGAADVAVDAAP